MKKIKKNTSLSEQDKVLIDQALSLGNTPDYQFGIDSLRKLYLNAKQNFTVCFCLGKLYYEHFFYKEAAFFFRKATLLDPGDELTSIALFHSRIKLKRKKSAFVELDRHLTRYPLKERYTLLLNECMEQIDKNANMEGLPYAEQTVLKHYRRFFNL
jgi:predicted Zn-dependent protease